MNPKTKKMLGDARFVVDLGKVKMMVKREISKGEVRVNFDDIVDLTMTPENASKIFKAWGELRVADIGEKAIIIESKAGGISILHLRLKKNEYVKRNK